ncbi:MAG: MATE family efflux transporter [Eubacteriales bacterium]|nr:MATE family efflux transporter [Eubacteriales bacterium]
MEKDLTEGKITPQLVKFTIPLVLGNLFQLTYNAVDSIIVGRFVGKEALAAVGICNPILTLFILFLNGLCLGASILMGNQFGAKAYDKLHRQISTTMISGIIFSVILSVICIIFAHPILNIMRVDPSIMSMTINYLRIIFAGLIFTFMYNCFASTLRALGDSQSPLYFLITSAVINIIGDLFFVLFLDWGSEGCAIATVLSEALSCLLCIIYIQRKVPVLQLGKKWLVFDKSLLGKTISYGWASAMQQATVQLGKLGIQAIVNSMGVSIAAAFAVVNRIDDFAYTPEQNIGHAMTALMAQSKGAGKKDRLKEAFKSGLKIEFIYGVIIFLVCFLLANPLMRLFTNDPDVIRHGVTYLRLISVMYLLPAATNGIQGYFRGIGDLKITLISSFVNMGVRVVVAAILVFLFSLQIEALPYSYLAGWIGMLIAELPLLIRSYKNLNS